MKSMYLYHIVVYRCQCIYIVLWSICTHNTQHILQIYIEVYVYIPYCGLCMLTAIDSSIYEVYVSISYCGLCMLFVVYANQFIVDVSINHSILHIYRYIDYKLICTHHKQHSHTHTHVVDISINHLILHIYTVF